MNRKTEWVLLLLLITTLCFSSVSWADLTVIGTATFNDTKSQYNLIYENNSIYGGLVWLDYTTSNGGSWSSQNSWASGLGSDLTISLNPGVTTTISDWSTGWRLPSAGDNPQVGSDQITSEMGHLYYVSLGDVYGGPNGLGDASPFENLSGSDLYWTSTEAPPSSAYWFDFYDGWQAAGNQDMGYHAIAVIQGNVSPTPIPGTIWLLASGLLGLVGFKWKFMRG